ncbi:MAG: alpha/beta fold hydrolase [Deltaproteobacteria bacterium]|nr:alpha/beta fold hydrolase [Deltaproteobacteria bacterium]
MRLLSLALVALAGSLTACATTSTPPPSEIPPALVAASTEPAAIEATGLTLEGTLHLPDHAEGSSVPGVVLVHGSGPNSRDQTVTGQLNMGFGFELALFVELAEALQAEGYAVLRYDKRTCGPFNGLCENDYPSPSGALSVNDFVDDAQVASRWLGAQPSVDASRVFVVGHSQGAAFMPAILSGEESLAGGVSLAGNWRPIDAILGYQLDFSIALMEAAGAPLSAIEAQLGSLASWVADLQAVREGTFTGDSIGNLPVGFWQEWMDLGDARADTVAAESRPMMALFGGYDWNIPLDPEAGLWAATGVTTVELECVTHALNCVSNPDWESLGADDIGRNLAPEVTSALVDWLDARAAE